MSDSGDGVPDALDDRYPYTRIVAAQLDPEEGVRTVWYGSYANLGSAYKILETGLGNLNPYAFALLLV